MKRKHHLVGSFQEGATSSSPATKAEPSTSMRGTHNAEIHDRSRRTVGTQTDWTWAVHKSTGPLRSEDCEEVRRDAMQKRTRSRRQLNSTQVEHSEVEPSPTGNVSSDIEDLGWIFDEQWEASMTGPKTVDTIPENAHEDTNATQHRCTPKKEYRNFILEGYALPDPEANVFQTCAALASLPHR